MEKRVENYAPIVGKERIDELKLLAEKLKGKTIQNINSTAGYIRSILIRDMYPE